MHDLIPLDPALPALGALTAAEIDATMAYAEAEKALATREAYASDWRRDFAAWCASRGATALPAHVGIVAAYLSWLADSGRKASTIGRRAAAIGYHHKIAGHEPPTSSEGVKAVLRGIRRTIGTGRAGKVPATEDVLTQMLALCPDNMIGHRDRTLLALGFAGAFRRSELCALQVDDLVEVADGLRILIRRSKTDQAGQGQEIAIPRGYRLRLVEAVQTWLAAAEISAGPVFRAVALGEKGLQTTPGGRQRLPHREAVCAPGRAGCRRLQRPQPAQWVPDQRGGERGVGVQAGRGRRLLDTLAAMCAGSICSRSAPGEWRRRALSRPVVPPRAQVRAGGIPSWLRWSCCTGTSCSRADDCIPAAQRERRPTGR